MNNAMDKCEMALAASVFNSI